MSIYSLYSNAYLKSWPTFSKFFCAFISVFLLSTTANAALISYSDFSHLGSDDIDYIVTIEDDAEAGVTDGHFRISYQVDPESTLSTAKLTGFFLEIDGDYNASNLDLINETATSCAQDFNTHQIRGGGGCNTNLTLGSISGDYRHYDWTLALAWKNNNDLSNGNIHSFEIADLGLSLNAITALGIRAQDTNGFGGSAKEFMLEPTTVIPLPASFWLFCSAIFSLPVIKRCNRTS